MLSDVTVDPEPFRLIDHEVKAGDQTMILSSLLVAFVGANPVPNWTRCDHVFAAARGGDLVAQRLLVTTIAERNALLDLYAHDLFEAFRAGDDWALPELLKIVEEDPRGYSTLALAAWWEITGKRDPSLLRRILGSEKAWGLKRGALRLLVEARDPVGLAMQAQERKLTCAQENPRPLGLVWVEQSVLDPIDVTGPDWPEVSWVCPASAAERSGFRAGDRVRVVAGEECSRGYECLRMLERSISSRKAFEVIVVSGDGVQRIRRVPAR